MRLRKIPIDFLWEGLELSGDIYNDRGSVLLLKRGEVLTQDRLDKLSKFERGGYITTSEETYQEILNSGKAPRAALQRVYEEAVGYTALKNDVDSIFSVTRNASEINMEATETVTKDIFTKIKVLDFPKIFQCIDAPREMDENLQRHSLNVAFTNGVIGQWLKLPEPVIKKLVCAGLVHDIGKTKEISAFPMNDYTDDGQLLGHIMIGAEMLHDAIREIPDFPAKVESELKHCILAHHGELEYGSPKKPALMEAAALNMADNTDAKMETFTELFDNTKDPNEWLGYNRLFESNIRKTSM